MSRLKNIHQLKAKALANSALNWIARVVLVAGVSYVVFLGYIGCKTVLGLKQVRNCANLQTLVWTVELFREKTGHYPVSIAQAVEASSMRTDSKKFFSAGIDAWGNPYLYQVRGDRFILVSYGRDGVAEPRDTGVRMRLWKTPLHVAISAQIFLRIVQE